MTDTAKTIIHLGAALHVAVSGRSAAPAVLLLHGGLGSMDDFAPLLPRCNAKACAPR
ncbi:alpha/beta fold hydrolase [Vandammella animalimorsus]|uniref:alpha/beta fold hydrolase n=1 Tax=Vandammella animalimorsus TaxID=2029117 RepID=UPI001EED2C97|nr:hypothetical protein [Vandammella animalimorsus]